MKRSAKIIISTLVAALMCFVFAACGDSVLKSIELTVDSSEYYAGDAFDTSSVSVNAVYADGSARTVIGWTIDAPDVLTAGELKLTVTYTEGGKTATSSFDITVLDKTHEHVFGTELKFDGEAHFFECSCGARSGETPHVKAGITVTKEADCTTDGEHAFVCSVCGYTGTEKVDALGHSFKNDGNDETHHWIACSRCDEVSDKTAHSLELYVDNFRTVYSEGDSFSLDGAVATVECEDCGFVKDIDASTITASKTVIGANDDGATVVLSYGSANTSVNISVVVKTLIGIRAESAKNKTAYRLNESFEKGKLTLEYNNQTTEDIDLTSDMVTDFATDSYGVKTLTVSHGEFDCTLDIAVVKELESSSGFVKFQAEDDTYVDMSAAEKQDVNAEKFETMMTLTNGGILPNEAEGSCTANISVKGNKITLRFYALAAGKFTLGMRAQSGSGNGRADQPIADALALTVNGNHVEIDGIIKRASSGNTDWRDMYEWTVLDDIAGEIDLVAGANVIEFAFLGETAANMRLPNIDYFTVDIAYENSLKAEVFGSADIPYGGSYTDGLTLTVKNGNNVLAENVPVTAEMISGLDNMQEGEQTVTVTYFGITTEHTVNVVVNRLTLTVEGGTFKDGSSTKELVYGEEIPEIDWTAHNIIGYAFDGTVLDSIDGLTMSSTDTTLKAISASEANNIKLTTTIRFNAGPTADDTGKTTGSVADTSATSSDVSVLGTNDGKSFALAVNKTNARGLTFKANINFGAGNVYVFVKVINNSDSELKGFAYGTEVGKVTVGDIAVNGSASAGKVITSDNANHWTNIFWDGEISTLDFTIAIYTYAVA